MLRHALIPTALLCATAALTGCDDSSAKEPRVQPTTTPTATTRLMSFLVDEGVVAPNARVAVPSAYRSGEPWYVVSADGDEFFGLWTVNDVTWDACHPAAHDPLTPGSSPEELADALVAQRSTSTTSPAPVTLAGYDGVYLEITGPAVLRDCGRFPSLWVDPERGLYENGQVDRVWILDVGGQRLVVDAAHSAATSADEIDELTAMVESLEFVDQ